MRSRIAPSIRIRITLWYVVVLAVVLALFSLGVTFGLRRSLERNLEASIERRATTLASIVDVRDDGPALPPAFIESAAFPDDDEPDDDDDVNEPDFDDEQYARTFAPDGSLVSDAGGVDAAAPIPRTDLRAALNGDARWLSMTGEDESYRVLLRPLVSDGRVVGVLEVGQSTEEVSDAISSLYQVLLVVAPLTLVVASSGGYFLAARSLAPIDRLTASARRISAEDLSTRIPTPGPNDEVGRLARTFNEMIARLEAAFRRQRQFTADASHELRTPLTAIKGQVDVTLSRTRDPEEYRAVLSRVNEEIDRLIRLVGTLLTLTRADAGEIPLDRESIDIADVIDGAVEQVRPLADERGVALHAVSGPVLRIEADQSLLVQLLLNLLDNAIDHTDAGGHVIVRWGAGGDRDTMTIEVEDTGVGIAAEHLPYIFDRFYRVDTARTRDRGGAGLGLAICRWIAEAHGGSISAATTVGHGTVFSVTLPARAARPNA